MFKAGLVPDRLALTDRTAPHASGAAPPLRVKTCPTSWITLKMGAKQTQWARSADSLLKLVADNPVPA